MTQPTFVRSERVLLQNHPTLDEKWVQDRIAENPAILGLGDLVLKDRERIQPKAGRLDLLLQDADSDRRYEVEIQLGKSDETHIIRTIEYWDIERKRYPQYDHCAVLVAEDITSRFLNVVGLFNGQIPIIAIQMSVFAVTDGVILVFTAVLDELTLGMDDEDEAIQEVTDRAYWEGKKGKATVAIADECLDLIHVFAPGVELRYNKFYIGLAENGRANNFVAFKPRKHSLNVEIRLLQSDDIQQKLDDAELDQLDYDKKSGRYRFRLGQNELGTHRELLQHLLQLAYDKKAG